ncbi:Pikachurin [Stylophora pistillata]|uniref:Pikachurin n=3 Tax=Stylophora pistillata TaxID=50429 RepID=A0A2B4R0H8_STYPI|nr:Pikachurin [Stylophora pistillata]
MRLEKFVFKRMSASAPYICDIRCGEEIICQSYNYNRKKEICELNNRSKEARPENFRSVPDWFYIRRLNGRVPLGSIVELPALSCQEIKASEGKDAISNKYWLNPTGNGKTRLMYCDMNLGTGDIDECVSDSFICGVNATCVNTNGSYGCTCMEEGSVGDGGVCSGKECRSILFKEPIRDKVMKGHLIRLVDVPHQGSCKVLCYLEPNCVSINFGPSQGGNYICELNNASDESQGSSDFQSKQDYTHLSIENPCSSSPCFNNGTCQAGYTEKGFRCKCPLGFTGVNCKKACSFDFEDGIGAWEMTGRAFIYQPTFGDNPKARKRETAKQQGDWWIGGSERRPTKSDPAGNLNPDGADKPNGTLTSPCFRIVGKSISFLIGGGCTMAEVRAELIVNNKVVRKETGNCRETMYRKSWDVEEFIGQYAQVRLVDESSGVWGHINFDDLKGDIICPLY